MHSGHKRLGEETSGFPLEQLRLLSHTRAVALGGDGSSEDNRSPTGGLQSPWGWGYASKRG